MDRSKAAYWIPTALFCLIFAGGGLAHLTQAAVMAEGVTGLGYPTYLMSILGPAKLVGVAVLLAPGLPVLKEWAYAGFTIDLLGASASHAFAGHPIGEVVIPLVLLAIGAASYALRPPSRRLADTSAGQAVVSQSAA